jgi:CMP/dCMP kinase
VVEGRDIGTVVWPDADVKVFLTASEHERARRRGGDTDGGGETAETLARRDALDSGRTVSPTRPAADALIIDSTTRSIDQVVDQILQLIEAARASRPR